MITLVLNAKQEDTEHKTHRTNSIVKSAQQEKLKVEAVIGEALIPAAKTANLDTIVLLGQLVALNHAMLASFAQLELKRNPIKLNAMLVTIVQKRQEEAITLIGSVRKGFIVLQDLLIILAEVHQNLNKLIGMYKNYAGVVTIAPVDQEAQLHSPAGTVDQVKLIPPELYIAREVLPNLRTFTTVMELAMLARSL